MIERVVQMAFFIQTSSVPLFVSLVMFFCFVLIFSIIFKSMYQTSELSKDCGTFFEGEDCKKGWDCIFVFQNLPIV